MGAARPRKVIDDDLRKKIIKLYGDDKLPQRAVAKRCGCGIPTVVAVLKEANIPIRSTTEAL